MRKLCLGLSFIAVVMLTACGSASGPEVSSELPPGFSERISSDGGSDNGGESSASGNKVSSASEGTSSDSSEGRSSVSEGGESADNDACIYDPDENTLTDLRDGQTYGTVKIGNQVWMAENLNYRYLGPTADLDSSSFCYDDDSANCDTYGRLYLWSAAMDSAGIIKGNPANGCGYYSECSPSGTVRGICPKGWHLPSYEEWEILIVTVDGSITEYEWNNTVGPKFRSSSGWNNDENGTDDYHFSALPAGNRHFLGAYDYEGASAYFWSSTEYDNNNANNMHLYHRDDAAGLDYISKDNGSSVRCLKD